MTRKAFKIAVKAAIVWRLEIGETNVSIAKEFDVRFVLSSWHISTRPTKEGCVYNSFGRFSLATGPGGLSSTTIWKYQETKYRVEVAIFLLVVLYYTPKRTILLGNLTCKILNVHLDGFKIFEKDIIFFLVK
ncbi:hypothetical protein NQ318_001532 [Aromia moschata]|uniref:Uncharacterized protein n=1 Tax=Aromia moschata TaxID=1265417 RepID=A0AAV8Y8H6_9CUCU|nr:hypothetical protein NQ318_001532 [Aromia moschata]